MRDIFKQFRGPDLEGSSANAYEIRCYECDVSFPVGTKRCIHCGGKTGPRSIFEEQIAGDPQVVLTPTFAPPATSATSPIGPSTMPEPYQGDLHETIEPLDALADSPDEEVKPRGSMLRAFGNLSWFLIIAALYISRSCAD
jgi:hypothetical protein